ncbi:acyl-CoA synthetase [Zhongshania aquimaris]|uniref:Acyl-CoA synthetase n=1 Tax=Zhongshania aquimaris TaxID=2857107 RepID=A0ABS6VWH2_9GAMM|nr:acyl-CoA synthetase [Zhongshania aquimaris]MBW2942673.1 acyl-CoA synthetase [Zhongshania aquimaris]
MTNSENKAIWSQSLSDLLRRSAKRNPKKTAIICGDVSWSYAEFDQICNRIANSFVGEGVGFGDRVAILSRNSHAFIAVRYALARIGAVIVPINFMLNAEEVGYILGHSEASILMVDKEHHALGAEAAQKSSHLKRLMGLPSEKSAETPADLLGFNDLIKGPTHVPNICVDQDDLAQLIYTSGTESSPKGAMLTHGAIIWEYVTCLVEAEIAERDTMLHALPLYHCAQLDAFLGPALYVGATNIITAVPSPDNLLPLMEQHCVNSFFAPPTVWIALLRSALFDTTNLALLQKGYYGASIMPVEILREIMRRLPELRLWNLYGQTEIAPVATMLKPEDQLRKAGSAGRAGLNIETRVIDDNGDDVEIGEIGEIVHRSPQLMSAYYKDEERTKSAFQDGWFHSGDLAIIDDEGFITVVDRKKDMIKTGGENVSSREVEEALYGLEAISEVAVIGLPDEKWIEAVCAVIVLKDSMTLDADAVSDYSKKHLAGFKIPKRIFFADSLPKNPSGKILKRDLREHYAKQ